MKDQKSAAPGKTAKKDQPHEPVPGSLAAADVLNWDYLVRIAEYVEGRVTSPTKALAGFAYAFTSTADEGIQNQMLIDLLRNATDHCSRDAAEEFIERLAILLQSDHKLLRQFARENGVRLKRG
jgi:hypothetical protein